MPSLNISSPSVPTLLAGLSPAAASPTAPVDGLASGVFLSVIESLGLGSSAEAPPTLKPSFGTTLPPERPDIAGDPPALQPLDVEAVMIGSGGAIPAPPQPAIEMPSQPSSGVALPPTIDTVSEAPAQPSPTTDSGAVACGLQDFTLGGASRLILARAIMRPMSGPLRLPPKEVSDLPASVEPAPEHGLKKAFEDPKPAVLVEAPASPPSLPFSPAVEAPRPLPSPKVEREESSFSPAATVTITLAAPQSLPDANSELQSLQRTPMQVAHATTQVPQGFSLSPDVARQVAQMIQAAVGEPSHHPLDTTPAADAALLADVSAPPPQAVAQPSTPLHASFVPAQRPIVDTGRAEWMQSMIEKIAEMPQIDNQREAQIHLIPDALGPVSVKIQQHDERMHVTLHAENPQARQLLADAAPRLQEIAEARGIRLTQGAIGGGESHDRRPAQDHQPAAPLRPRPAKAGANAEPETQGDLIA